MTETEDVLRAFGQRLVSDHPLGNHLCGGRRILVKCPSQVLGESVLAALPPPPASVWVCPNCNGSGLDTTWHEGAPCAETHQCGYCAGDTAQPLTPAPPPWTDCPEHPPLATPGPHGFCSCEDRERRFREMTRACQDPLSRYATVADLARAVMNAAGGHDALGRCAAPHLAEFPPGCGGRATGCHPRELGPGAALDGTHFPGCPVYDEARTP